MIELTTEQQEIHDKIVDWILNPNKEKQYISIAGYAGTGKTTLLSFLSHTLYQKGLKKAFCTFTGKASQVLKEKMRTAESIYPDDSVSTIHSLIYKPVIDENDDIVDWELNQSLDYNLIILDEASMVGKDLWQDLLSFNIPILCSGDSGQLDPIGENSFNLVKNPDFRLTTIHRQAKDNPIIKLSFYARKGIYIKPGIYGEGIAKVEENDVRYHNIMKNLKVDNDLMILCGTNKTRVLMNNFIREKLGIDLNPHPQPGEKIICLKNNKKADIMNGQLGIVEEIYVLNDDFYRITVLMDGKDYPQVCLVLRDGFGQQSYNDSYTKLYSTSVKKYLKDNGWENCELMDFGYACTVHKAQGSEFNRVILFSERTRFMDDVQFNKWLYTGITRAKSKLLIVE